MHRTDKKHINSQTWSFLGLTRVRTKRCHRQWAASGAAGPSEEREPAQRRHGGGRSQQKAAGARLAHSRNSGGQGAEAPGPGPGRLWLESGFILTGGVMELAGAGLEVVGLSVHLEKEGGKLGS